MDVVKLSSKKTVSVYTCTNNSKGKPVSYTLPNTAFSNFSVFVNMISDIS